MVRAERGIALFGIVAEGRSFWLFSWVPIGEGTPPNTNPFILGLGYILVLIHYPALLVQSSFGPNGTYVWWAFAFTVGYIEITLAAAIVYWGANFLSRTGSRGTNQQADHRPDRSL